MGKSFGAPTPEVNSELCRFVHTLVQPTTEALAKKRRVTWLLNESAVPAGGTYEGLRGMLESDHRRSNRKPPPTLFAFLLFPPE